jgi:hypothetical protein
MCDAGIDIDIPSVDGTTSSVIAVVSGIAGLIAGGGWPSDSVPSSFNNPGVLAESSIFSQSLIEKLGLVPCGFAPSLSLDETCEAV